MELLCRPVADWELRTRIDSVAKSGKEPEPHVDVCTGCKVDGGCNDVDIHCGLVAIHNRQADGTVATSLKKRSAYLKSLISHVKKNGDTPFPAQRELIASVRADLFG